MKHLIHWLLVPYRGSNRISRILRRKIEATRIRQTIGVYLSGLAVFSAVLVPQATDFVGNLEVARITEQTFVEVIPTNTKFQWPFSRFGLTTRFSGVHPGVDLINPVGLPIYPIAGGWVEWVISSNWGYGNHVLIEHDGGIKSLYGHMSKIDVQPGQTVDKTTKLGEVGSTGWSTGSHVHLEIYQNNVPINPLEVLPSVPALTQALAVPQVTPQPTVTPTAPAQLSQIAP